MTSRHSTYYLEPHLIFDGAAHHEYLGLVVHTWHSFMRDVLPEYHTTHQMRVDLSSTGYVGYPHIPPDVHVISSNDVRYNLHVNTEQYLYTKHYNVHYQPGQSTSPATTDPGSTGHRPDILLISTLYRPVLAKIESKSEQLQIINTINFCTF